MKRRDLFKRKGLLKYHNTNNTNNTNIYEKEEAASLYIKCINCASQKIQQIYNQ